MGIFVSFRFFFFVGWVKGIEGERVLKFMV